VSRFADRAQVEQGGRNKKGPRCGERGGIENSYSLGVIANARGGRKPR
jgi:hypothetical protein